MRLRTLISPLFFALLGTACQGTAGAAANPPTHPTGAAQPAAARLAADPAGNELAMDALHTLAPREQGNLFFSGTSLRAALGMTALGADGATLAEMASTLHLAPDASGNVARARLEAAAWKTAAGSAQLSIANRIWLANRFRVDPTFTQRTQDGYGASAGRVDFFGQPDAARLQINRWVSAETHDKIPSLLPEGSIPPTTRLVLTNAVYFRGSWADGFQTSATTPAPFHTASGDATVPTMHRTGEMLVAENDAATLVELPYKDSELSMLIVLPAKADGLGALASTLSASQLGAWAASMKKDEIALAMPKFEFAWGRSVKSDLEQMGIRRLFSSKAELVKLGGEPDDGIYVSDVVHKAFVHVDETGTEAAAATGVVAVARATAIRFVKPVSLDRPFLFFVRDRATGNVLFSGRLSEPRPT